VPGPPSAAFQHAPGDEQATIVVEGFGRLTVPTGHLVVADGRVLVDITDAAVAAELDAAGITVVHHDYHPDPTVEQIAEAVRRLPSTSIDLAMTRVAHDVGMDASFGQVALLAIALVLEDRVD
jgi:hypothetical protein